MDLSILLWEAVHNDKTVTHPNYIDIKRDTLQQVSLFKKTHSGREYIVKFTRPKCSKWLFSFRMRSQLENGTLARRFWIFNDRTRQLITRVHEDGKIDNVKNWEDLEIKPATITKIDEL